MERKQRKRKMKRRLHNWGRALEQFAWKEEQLKKLQMFYEMKKKIWEGSEDERSRRELERIEKDFWEESRRLRIEMVEILREKARMDEMIQRMTQEEVQFLQMRFEKGYGFDYIGMKMHLSRATLFRIQDKALEQMIEMETETG